MKNPEDGVAPATPENAASPDSSKDPAGDTGAAKGEKKDEDDQLLRAVDLVRGLFMYTRNGGSPAPSSEPSAPAAAKTEAE